MKSIVNNIDLKSPIISPSFSGVPTAPTPTTGDNSTKLATTAFVSTAVVPLATTVYVDTEIFIATSPLAPTAYVDSEIDSAVAPLATTTSVNSLISNAVAPLATTTSVNSSISGERTAAATLTNKTIVNPAGLTQYLVDSPVTAWNMELGQFATWIVNATGRTLASPTNFKSGVMYTLLVGVVNPSTTTVSWPSSFRFQYGIPPDTSTSQYTLLSLIWSPAHTQFLVFPAPGM
jgi:hypothetical protein